MMQNPAMRARRAACTVALVLAPVGALRAQTNDESRLTFGMSAGYIGGTMLWDVANQPILSSFEPPDLFHLHRETHGDITVSGHATFYRGPHIGFTGEFTYVGLGATDSCNLVQDGGDAELFAACSSLKGAQGSAPTTLIQGGMVYRPLARADLQPYLKGLVGVAFTPSSLIAMQTTYGAIGDTTLNLTIYQDDSWKEVRPTWTAAIGISTAPSSGYQVHVEFRESWMPLDVITGATAGQGFVPPRKTVIKGFPSVLIGFDIVLEKRRGRRY